ncbi:hypothetical protein [Streptomyces roseoviridis]|uniref:Leucine-rich repeat domain-containing protein n=1 Tax=Streptomyces roseoviridis TaxID=67361 RepID=A0ABV5QY75_9ACTN
MKIIRRPDGRAEMFVIDEPWDPVHAERFADGTCDGLVVGAPTDRKAGPDLAFLPGLTGLRSLRVLKGIADLSPVARCTGLERLRLPASAARALDLSGLVNLRELEIPWPAGARSVHALTSVEDLVITRWKGESLSVLGDKPALRSLRIESVRNHVTDAKGAALLPGLDELRFYDGRLARAELLSGAAALTDVSLLSTKTDAIDFVAGLPRLRRLELENSGEIASLAPLAAHPALREVVISGSTRVADGDLSPLVDNSRLTFVAVERGHAHDSHAPHEVRKG